MSEKIADIFKLTHISMQCLLNDYMSNNPGGEDTIHMKKRFNSGMLVSDEIVNSLFALRVTRRDAKELGACIDGYPKTEGQMNYLKNTLKIDPTFVIVLECPEHLITERNRIVDTQTGQKYSLQMVRESDDFELKNRIQQVANESTQVMQKRIANWDNTRKLLHRFYDKKVVTINVEKMTEEETVEKIVFLLSKLRTNLGSPNDLRSSAVRDSSVIPSKPADLDEKKEKHIAE